MKQAIQRSAAPLVLVTAGEVSGDILAAEVMLALRRQVPGVRFAGVGGAKMQAAGLEVLGDMEVFPGMGLVEVVGGQFRACCACGMNWWRGPSGKNRAGTDGG